MSRPQIKEFDIVRKLTKKPKNSPKRIEVHDFNCRLCGNLVKISEVGFKKRFINSRRCDRCYASGVKYSMIKNLLIKYLRRYGVPDDKIMEALKEQFMKIFKYLNLDEVTIENICEMKT